MGRSRLRRSILRRPASPTQSGLPGRCAGWIQFSGNPLSSPAGWVAIGLSVLGGIGMLILLRMLIHVPAVPVGR